MRLRAFIVAALCAALCCFGNHDAQAATLTSPMTVVAAVNMRCSIFTVTVAFGTYDLMGANATTPLDAIGGVSLNCDRGRVVRVRLDQGLYPAAGSSDNAPLRQMGQGTDRLSYNLYVDAAHSQVWSNASPGERPATNTFPQVMPVYGRVPAGQVAQAGAYSDTVVATITF